MTRASTPGSLSTVTTMVWNSMRASFCIGSIQGVIGSDTGDETALAEFHELTGMAAVPPVILQHHRVDARKSAVEREAEIGDFFQRAFEVIPQRCLAADRAVLPAENVLDARRRQNNVIFVMGEHAL